METYKIVYFSTKKGMSEKIFKGENAFENAKKWGKKNLNKDEFHPFQSEMIRLVR